MNTLIYQTVKKKKKKKLNDKYDPTNLILDTYDYSIWFKKE